MAKILLVEDDAVIRESLSLQLAKGGFQVHTAASVAEARVAVQKGCDIALLDWELPDGEGLSLLREWRGKNLQFPVIFLTARTDVVNKVLALELGADDYLTKPFEVAELLARVRARLRMPAKAASAVLRAGDLEVNLSLRTVTYQSKAVELKKMEFELLKYFMENPDRPLARDELLNKVWGMENFPTSRTVDTHVLSLRKKISADFIETLHSFGYRFRSKP